MQVKTTPVCDGSLQCVVHLHTCRATSMWLVYAAQLAKLLATCDGVWFNQWLRAQRCLAMLQYKTAQESPLWSSFPGFAHPDFADPAPRFAHVWIYGTPGSANVRSGSGSTSAAHCAAQPNSPAEELSRSHGAVLTMWQLNHSVRGVYRSNKNTGSLADLAACSAHMLASDGTPIYTATSDA